MRNPTPIKALADRLGFDLDSLKEITGYKQSNLYKALRDKTPKGWQALLLEVDRLHRANTKVLEARITLLEHECEALKAELKALRDKL